MSAVHPPANPSAASSDASTFNEGMPIPSAFIRTEVIRMFQREQEKAVALLETSPLLSYLFFSYAISNKAAPDSPLPDHSEELSALKVRSEKLESELTAAQMALTEAHDLVETLRDDVQQLRADMIEDRSREAAILKEREKEKEDLRKEAQAYKSESDALRRSADSQQLDMARTKQQYIAEKAALQARLNELQQFANELSRRQEVAAAPIVVALEESVTDGMLQGPERPSTPMRHSQHVPHTLSLLESPRMQRPGSPEVTPFDPPIRQVPTTPSDIQTFDQSPPTARTPRSQKFKAKRAAKKRAQEAQEDPGVHLAREGVTMGLP